MKRILYVLITLFMFVGYQTNAQGKISVNIGSGNAGTGNTVFIPIEVQYPPGSVTLDVVQGAIELTDPSVAEIVAFTKHSVNQIIDGVIVPGGDRFLFLTNVSAPIQDVEGLIFILEIKMTDVGCTDVIFTDFSSTTPSEFIVDGNIYDDLTEDYIISNGQACGVLGTDCQFLPTPPNPSCHLVLGKFSGYQVLSWGAVANEISYELEIIENDRDGCCAGVVGERKTRIISTSSNSINLPTDGGCFSWRVRAVCANGTKSPWTTKMCSCGPIAAEPGGNPSLSGYIMNPNTPIGGQLELMAVPNPASGHVDLSFWASLTEDDIEDAELLIYDMSGKQMHSSLINSGETKRIDLNSFNSGMYIVKIAKESAILTTKKLIVE